jgi:Phosphohistidine phosphatase SixA
MGLILYLLRHAQSADKQFGQSDEQRELTTTGKRDSERAGFFLKQQGSFPDLVMCSTAIRTRQTCEIVINSIGNQGTRKVNYMTELYHGSFETYLEILKRISSPCQRLLLIGHNPSISELAQFLADEKIIMLLPAGLVELHFEYKHWHELTGKSGELISMIDPSVSAF